MPKIRAVLIGNASVGKTCITQRIFNGNFNEFSNSTIGGANVTFDIKTKDQKTITFSLWDTAGQERYRSLSTMYFNQAGLAFLVFDLTSFDSFKSLEDFYLLLKEKVNENIPIIIVGNKSDLKSERNVQINEINNFITQIKAKFYIETSAKTGEGINELFEKAANLDDLIFEKDFLDNLSIPIENNSEIKKKKCC